MIVKHASYRRMYASVTAGNTNVGLTIPQDSLLISADWAVRASSGNDGANPIAQLKFTSGIDANTHDIFVLSEINGQLTVLTAVGAVFYSMSKFVVLHAWCPRTTVLNMSISMNPGTMYSTCIVGILPV